MTDILFQIGALIIPMILAIVFHEVAHGWTARALGDPTAANMGRLSLNPIKHVDPFGTVILPGMLGLLSMPIFGWAKPVPVIKGRLRNPRRDMMIVAAAGPGSNLVMGIIGAVLLGLISPPEIVLASRVEDVMLVFAPFGILAQFIGLSLFLFITLNVFLALFNLLPIPPFDGGHIVEGLLPPAMARKYGGMHNKAMLIAILLIVVVPYVAPSLNIVSWLIVPPVQWLSGHYMALAGLIAGG